MDDASGRAHPHRFRAFHVARAREQDAGLGLCAGLPGTADPGSCTTRGVVRVPGPGDEAHGGIHNGGGDRGRAVARSPVCRPVGCVPREPPPRARPRVGLYRARVDTRRRSPTPSSVSSLKHLAPRLGEALERTERLLPLLEMPGPAVCHGDFHPANLLIDSDWISVIDWTHAGVGDRHGDIAWTVWLFDFAAVAAPQYRQRLALRVLAPAVSRAHLSAYRRHLPVDISRLRLWMPLNLLHAWAIAVADEQEVFHPSRAGHDFRAGLAARARKQFWWHIKLLS
jgi:Phosphotransferase enzyme family